MTATEFYKLVLALWGEDWRKELTKLLDRHAMKYSRQTFWNWRTGNSPVPDSVALILNKEAKRKGIL